MTCEAPYIELMRAPLLPLAKKVGPFSVSISGNHVSKDLENDRQVQQQVVPQKMLKQRVVNMTNSRAQVWTNPFVNQTYGVWDQVPGYFIGALLKGTRL